MLSKISGIWNFGLKYQISVSLAWSDIISALKFFLPVEVKKRLQKYYIYI